MLLTSKRRTNGKGYSAAGYTGEKELRAMADVENNQAAEGQAQNQQDPDVDQQAVEQQQATPDGQQAQDQPSTEDLNKRVQGLETAAAEERRKRQAAEQELEWIRQNQAQPQPQYQQPQQQPDIDWSEQNEQFWKNQAGYVHQTSLHAAQHAVEQHFAAREARRLHASEQRVAAQHDDYREKYVAFRSMLQSEPELWNQVVDAAEPAQAMYDLVQRRQTYGATPDEMRKKIEAEVRAKIEAEKRGSTAQQIADSATPSQGGARGTGPSSAQTSLADGRLLDDVMPNY